MPISPETPPGAGAPPPEVVPTPTPERAPHPVVEKIKSKAQQAREFVQDKVAETWDTIKEERKLKRSSLDDLEKRMAGEKGVGSPDEKQTARQHEIEAAFKDDGVAGFIVSKLLRGGASVAEAIRLTDAELHDRETAGGPKPGVADAEWTIQNEDGQRFRVKRIPIYDPFKAPEDQEYVMEIDQLPDAMKGKDFKLEGREDQVYTQKLTQELEKGRELSPERMEYLFKDLVRNGADSALAQLGSRVEGFKNFQQAMVRLDVDVAEMDNGQIIERESRGPINDLIDKIPSVALRESVRNTIRSGTIGAGVVATIGFLGGPVTWAAFGAGLAGSFTARWIASHFSREKKLFKPQKEGEATLADQSFDTLFGKIKTAHRAALAAEARTETMSEEEAQIERTKAMQAVVALLRKRDEGVLETFRKTDKTARRWEGWSSFAGGVLGAGALTTMQSLHKIAELHEHGIRMVDGHLTNNASEGHLVKQVHGIWSSQYGPQDVHHIGELQKAADAAHGGIANPIGAHYFTTANSAPQELNAYALQAALQNNNPIFHTGPGAAIHGAQEIFNGLANGILHGGLDQTAAIAGALSAGNLWAGMRTGYTGVWDQRRAKKALSVAHGLTKQWLGDEVEPTPLTPPPVEGVTAKPEEAKATGGKVELVPEPVKERMATYLGWLVENETNNKVWIDKLAEGEDVGEGSIITPHSIDSILGGFVDRDQLIAELPNRLTFAEQWIKEALISRGPGSLQIEKLNALQKMLTKVRQEIEADGIAEQFTELSEQLQYKQLSKKFALIEKDVFNKDLPSVEIQNSPEFFQTLLLQAGAKEYPKFDLDAANQLRRYLELKGALLTGDKEDFCRRLVNELSQRIATRGEEVAAEKAAAAAAEAAKKQGGNRNRNRNN